MYSSHCDAGLKPKAGLTEEHSDDDALMIGLKDEGGWLLMIRYYSLDSIYTRSKVDCTVTVDDLSLRALTALPKTSQRREKMEKKKGRKHNQFCMLRSYWLGWHL